MKKDALLGNNTMSVHDCFLWPGMRFLESWAIYTQHETYPFYITADPILLYRINPMEVLHQMEFLIKLFAMVMVS